MAWKARPRGGPYYYKSVRVPGRATPVSVYLGTGEAARHAARVVADNLRRREANRRAADAEADRFADAENLARELRDWREALFAAAMARAGFRKHHGSWRKGRVAAMTVTNESAGEVRGAAGRPGWRPNLNYAREAVKSIVRRVKEGDAAAAAHLPGWLEKFPELLAEVESLAGRAESAWLAAATEGDPVQTQALKVQSATLRAALRGSKPSPAVALLADEVVLAELAARHAETVLAATPAGSPVTGVWQRRAESAQRRLRAAVTALARVRALESTEASPPAEGGPRRAEAQPAAVKCRSPAAARRARA